MPTFNKSRGFKLKSGNTISFKEMGGSPVLQQADATLVAAARHAAMQNVPKDLSAQFNKTAEGVIAANKGQTEMLKTAAKELPGVAIAAGRGIQKGVGKIKSRIAARKEVKKAMEGQGYDYKDMSKEKRKEFGLTRKDIRKAADQDFEASYKEEHKDRKSIADIREITGATTSKKSKKKKGGINYEKLLKQHKAQVELEKLNKEENKNNANNSDIEKPTTGLGPGYN